ncbi:MAG: hypothetical protein EPN79_10880 [Burkholderiaceae bacterium]|nr:MAG: hypothetical protein EPN79_10880 [Burkholderiaceae bacterium]TBR76811.1 MAG: hypothetical protein EPN64_06195 [Burkholderiaceae bacterium]
MPLFSKKPAKSTATGRQPLSIALDESGIKAIAFGLTWRSVASRGSARQDAIRAAKLVGATHLISKQQQYGYGAIAGDVSPSTRIYPAALVAARQHGGDAIYALKVFEGEYWFAVVRGGQPSSTDRIIHSENDLEVIDAARHEIESGVEDDVHYVLYTNIEDHGLGERVRGLTAADLLLAASGEDDLLGPIPKSSSNVPRPVLYMVLTAIALVFISKGWGMYKEHERQRLARLHNAAEEPPAQAWAAATNTWMAQHVAGDPQGLAAPRVSLGKVPLLLGGWVLKGAACNAITAPAHGPAMRGGARVPASAKAGHVAPAAPSRGERVWGCYAQYIRPVTGVVNRELKGLIPAGWSVQYKGIDEIVASWDVLQATRPFSMASLKPVDYHMVQTISKLQHLQPALAQIAPLNFIEVKIPPPRSKDGKAMPMPASVPKIKQTDISVMAPLRSVDALIDSGVDADWKSISISFVEGSADQASLRSSSMMANVKGVLYAKG